MPNKANLTMSSQSHGINMIHTSKLQTDFMKSKTIEIKIQKATANKHDSYFEITDRLQQS
jgi:hypothetical protein